MAKKNATHSRNLIGHPPMVTDAGIVKNLGEGPQDGLRPWWSRAVTVGGILFFQGLFAILALHFFSA